MKKKIDYDQSSLSMSNLSSSRFECYKKSVPILVDLGVLNKLPSPTL